MQALARLTNVYVLTDENGTVRYVGISGKPKRRLWRHIDDAKKGSQNYCHRWIRTMLSANLTPKMVVIESNVPEEREVHWISHYRAQGAPLTNVAPGGPSPAGYKLSPEQRAKISERNRTRVPSAATREAIAAALRGQRPSQETRAKLSAARLGKPRSEQMVQRMRASLKGRVFSPETIEKMRAGAHRRGALAGAPRDSRGRLLPRSNP